MDFLTWLHNSTIGVWVRESDWGYPIVLTSHAIGMAIVVGAVLMFDLRALGYGKRLAMTWFDKIFVVAWGGFALNLISGLGLFAGDPVKFVFHRAFQIKIVLIIAGGISVWMLGGLASEPERLPAGAEFSLRTKVIATISLIFWIGAIAAGRLIAYT
jgi:hypothetical protein